MKGKRLLSLILSVAMLLMCMPLSAYAANGESVIDKVTYKGTSIAPKDRNIVLSVPASFTGSIDMSSELSISYIKLNYKYFAEMYPEGATIKYGETKILRTQYEVTENGKTSSYTSDYKVSLQKNEFISPSFEGRLSLRLSMDGSALQLSKAQFEKLYKQNDGKAMGGITIEGAKASVVTFSVNNGSPIDTSVGGKVQAANLDRLYLQPKGVGTASFKVSAYDTDGKTVDGYISLDVEVIKSTKLADINIELSQLETYGLRRANLATIFQEAAKKDIDSVKITELPTLGRLVHNYSSDGSYGNTASRDTYMSIADFNMLSYIPNRDSITRNVADSVKFTAKDKDGNEFTGSINISVIYQRMGLEDMSATIKKGEPVKLINIADIQKQYEANGSGTFGYVYFTLPDSSNAQLRYNYRSATQLGDAVKETDAFYITGTNRKYLNSLYFVPDSDYSGSVYLYYEAYNSNQQYPLFGRIRVNVATYELTDLSYSVYQDEYLNFEEIGSDINSKFKSADGTSGGFNYVRFTLPSASYGTLWYGYKSSLNTGSRVGSSDNYYRSGSGRLLSDVSFVPTSSYSGSFVLKYNAYDNSNNAYSGEIEINVKETKYDVETLVLNIKAGRNLEMPVTAINNAVRDASGGASFNYLYFSDLPLSRSGALYYGRTAADKGTAVEEDSNDVYNRTGSEKLLSDVVFAANSAFAGDTELEYRAFVSKTDYYDGKIIIRVAEGNGTLPDISYETPNNLILGFWGADFSDALKTLTNDSLDYVIFELPPAEAGELVFEYTSDSKYGYKVKAGDKFDRLGSGDLISDLDFVPKLGYIGSFDLNYTAYDSVGEQYDGVVKIKILRASDFEDVSKVAYYYDSVNWAVDKGITEGTSRTRFSPDKDCTRAHVITFLWRAKGCPEPKSVVSPFPDIKDSDYFYKAAIWAFENDIYPGTKEGNFAADKVCTRRDFVYLLWMAEGQPSPGTQKNVFEDVKDDDAACKAILWAYKTGVTDGTSATRFSPDSSTNRAQVVTFLYRAYK
jgi:hypothetical protein